MSDDSVIVTERHPDWRARLVVDEYCGQPYGDALAPALLIERGHAVWACEVYQPQHADRILVAWRHFDGDELFERYLRLVHGTTAIRYITGRDLTAVTFDTADYRTHAGITGMCDLTGEHDEWRAWLDGDIYGVIVEHHTATGCWTEHDSLWGLYGHTHAAEQAQMMLAAAVATTR